MPLLAAGSGPNYTVDTLAPTVTSIVMSDSALKINDTSTVTITFSEAVLKALGAGLGACKFVEIEVMRSEGGAPSLALHGAARALAVGDSRSISAAAFCAAGFQRRDL